MEHLVPDSLAFVGIVKVLEDGLAAVRPHLDEVAAVVDLNAALLDDLPEGVGVLLHPE